ncbi:SAV_2336 N-terminal domain-related protein [Streptomyces sp. NPDC052773]|uniref:SAV_2336 N-terminal domain-related protein n=1 Tax=Streptomyces sp. NPDC052773 TaxID=3365693 RepID=UPI0037D1B0C2
MPSEHPSADALARLADLLAEASSGDRPSPRELAELLWLAGHMEAPPEPEGEPGAGAGTGAGQRAEDRTPIAERPVPPPPGDDTPPPAPGERRPEPPRARLHLPAPGGTVTTTRHASLLAPAPPMLRHPLALQRALRPLKRRTEAPLGHELDERATAERIARLGGAPDAWLPVMRPARERWLSLRLVHDTGPTMPVWWPLVRELYAVLAQSGVFRTVTLHPAAPDGTVPAQAAHTPADGRTVVLLVSDCMGPQWRKGPAADRWYATLRRWAHRMPLAVVQPLPEHLWRDTALPTTPGRLSAPGPAAPTATLRFTPYDDAEEAPAEGTLFLPVLEADPHWLANWAGLTASSGGTRHPAAVARLDSAPAAPDDRTDLALLTPEELVLRFRATASPEAFRLAGHLALGRPDLPVMRLVQAAVEPDPRPRHLAEIILSGMLTAVPGSPGSYAFRPGVRELLLRGLPRTARAHTTELLEQVGALIDTRAGRAPGEFLASTPAEGGTASTGVEAEAFATVSEESVRRLTGGGVPVPPGLKRRYRLLRRLLNPPARMWRAKDTETNRTVVVRLHRPVTDAARREAFLRDAESLREIRHPHVVRVHDFGIEDDIPYVVMEDLNGIPLNCLAAPYGYRLPMPLRGRIDAQLAQALTAVHRAGLVHGGIGMSRVVVLPDGTVKLSLFELGKASGDAGRSADLRALSDMLGQLASGTNGPAQAYDRRFYHVLGPLRVELPDGGPELPRDARALLAMLLLKHGRAVTHDELRAGLWARRDEPRDAMAALGRAASRLRTLLGPDAALATLPDGYALHTSADHVDLVECERLVARADGQDARQARDLYDQALALWGTEDPLSNVPGPAAQTARTRLLQLRLTLSRRRAELDLDLGEVDRAADDLAGLVRAHPSREDFRRLYLIALRRQGRLEEALEVFEEYELSGGRSPELLALGRELREEYGGPPDEDGVAVLDDDARTEPDDLPAGSFPTEEDLPSLLAQDEESRDDRPLPRDEVPESLFPDAAPAPPRRSGSSAVRALRAARAVIFGFDGTLTRLYTEDSRSETLRDLARLLAEERSPDDALAGHPLLPPEVQVAPQGYRLHPLDLLRAFRDSPQAHALHNRLTAAERVAARAAMPSPNADLLVRTLAGKGRRLAVVTDTAPRVAADHLERHGLLDCFDGGVHGRDSGRTPLPPDPDTVRRAIAGLGVPPAACLVIGTTAAEEEAARAAGASYLPRALRPLLHAAREL